MIEHKTLDSSKGTSHNIPQHHATQYAQPEKQEKGPCMLKMDGMEGNKETAKQNHEDDTLSIYGSEDGEIVTDKNEEKEEESKKIIFREFGQISEKSQEKQHSNLLHSMFTHAAIKLSIQGKWKCSVWDSK